MREAEFLLVVRERGTLHERHGRPPPPGVNLCEAKPASLSLICSPPTSIASGSERES